MAESAELSCSKDDNETSWVPKVDMLFKSDDEAYQFYNSYARAVGFSVRKAWVNRRASGVIISRTFVCYKEGYQGNKKNDGDESKKCRKNERTGCLAHMIIKITENGEYRMSEFHPMHNHELVPLDNANMLKSHRVVKKRKANAARSMPQMSMIEYLVRRAGGYRQVKLFSVEEAAYKSWAPKLDMEFEHDDKAYEFYTEYGKKIGFDVRKAWVNRRLSGVIVSRTYVCYKAGFYGNKKDKGEVERHKPGPNERTGCPARMIIKLAKNGRYRVSEFQPRHNHEFVTARTIHMLKSHRATKKPEAMAVEDEANKKVSFPSTQCKSFTTPKLNDSMKIGDVGSILQYMQEKQSNDPSFYYAVRLNDGGCITGVFWADGKSKFDYNYFYDVICFDMTYKTNCYGKPLALFYGVNHHKQLVFFGSALLYTETEESFKWLFWTFETAMCGKQPRVILTDRDELVHNAIVSVWKNTTYYVCTWHIYHSMMKQLSQVFQGSRTFSNDFSRCLYDCEEEQEFLSSWGKMMDNYELKDNLWLNKLFEDKESWAIPYRRESFCGDMHTAQRAVNLPNVFKEQLSQERDFLQFFGRFERIVNKHREEEVQADSCANQSPSWIVPSRVLKQAAHAYTPKLFDIFQREFEFSMDCMVYKCGEIGTISEYKVTIEENPEGHLVKFDSLNDAITCSCKKFEFIGVQCRHVLKTLDILNIKELSEKYLLKRWRKDAKVGFLRDNDIDPNLSKAQRYSILCRIFGVITAKAAETHEAFTFVVNQSHQLVDDIDQILMTRPPEER